METYPPSFSDCRAEHGPLSNCSLAQTQVHSSHVQMIRFTHASIFLNLLVQGPLKIIKIWCNSRSWSIQLGVGRRLRVAVSHLHEASQRSAGTGGGPSSGVCVHSPPFRLRGAAHLIFLRLSLSLTLARSISENRGWYVPDVFHPMFSGDVGFACSFGPNYWTCSQLGCALQGAAEVLAEY